MANLVDQDNKLDAPLHVASTVDNIDNNANIYVNIQQQPPSDDHYYRNRNRNRKLWICICCTVVLTVILATAAYFSFKSDLFIQKTPSPAILPTVSPTASPSVSPTNNPTQNPTKPPTKNPTINPTESPTKSPTAKPTAPISIFGGMYSTAANSAYNVNNAYTNTQSCPANFTPHHVAYFLACYRCGGVNLYLCLRDGLTSDPRGFFGGIYNTNGCGGTQVPNPLTGGYTCDTSNGYQPHLIIASQTDGYCDTNVYACFGGGLDYYNLGGFWNHYTQSDGGVSCSTKYVNNEWSNALSCPDGYVAHILSFTYSPGGASGYPGCNGWAYICLMP